MPICQEEEMATTALTRRRVLAAGAAATAALSAPFVRGAYAAGKLSVGFWDHWVPGSNDTLRKLAQQWAEKEKVDLLKQHVGLDVTQMYPAGRQPDKELADKWSWDFFLQAAEKCAKAGVPFGMPMGPTSDAVDWVGAVFASHGSTLVDEKGDVTVKSDATRQVLEWFKKLVPALPPDVFAWDDASNNKILVSGKSALIMNPPSAWAVAKRDAPKVAEQLWTFPAPKGPKGRYEPFLPYYWTVWSFSQNKPAAKSLLTHLSQRASVEQLVAASQGYDIPPYDKLRDFKTWAEQGPPPGTIYNYPPRDPDRIASIAAAPAPPDIAVQIYTQATMTKMIAHGTKGGESIERAIAWAADEPGGVMRCWT